VRGAAVRMPDIVASGGLCARILPYASGRCLPYCFYPRFFEAQQSDLYWLFCVRTGRGLCHGMMETQSRFCRVGVETRQKILECIGDILAVIQQKDYEQFRLTAGQGALVLANLAKLSEMCASLRYEDVVSLIDSEEQTEQEKLLRLLIGFKEYLPSIGGALTKLAEMFPKSQGGHPENLKDLQSKRKLCSRILSLIASGRTEAQAKKIAAQELVAKGEVEKISPRTVHRIWEVRAELEKQSIEEFLSQFWKSLSTTKLNAVPTPDANSTTSTENPA